MKQCSTGGAVTPHTIQIIALVLFTMHISFGLLRCTAADIMRSSLSELQCHDIIQIGLLGACLPISKVQQFDACMQSLRI